jgi:hypothetical protein
MTKNIPITFYFYFRPLKRSIYFLLSTFTFALSRCIFQLFERQQRLEGARVKVGKQDAVTSYLPHTYIASLAPMMDEDIDGPKASAAAPTAAIY